VTATPASAQSAAADTDGPAAERLVIGIGERREAVVDFIDSARADLSLSLFRCDDDSVLDAVGRAARRGVHVRALVTGRARGSKTHLKELRKRMTRLGADVRRYADPVVRYHAKYAIADNRSAMVASLNYTRKCFDATCDFVLVSQETSLAGELQQLFDADWDGRPYAPAADRLIVAPDNARQRFVELLRQATRTIRLIDPKVQDPGMLTLLKSRAADGVGVDVRSDEALGTLVPHGKLLVIDDDVAVIGSIAMSTLALEFRRELAVAIRDRGILERVNEFWDALPNQEPAS
jgi:phosphatidylserine/phosphatidylglycerophosphate/cardiolipin synthase-like enzyme